MRKRTVNHLADTIFWYILYALPVIGYICVMISCPTNGATYNSFEKYITNFGINIAENNIIFNALKSILGEHGTLPLFADNTFLTYLTYFINIYIMHLLVDFILFIPRICHKYMEKFTQKEE